MKVVILDGNENQAVACVRSLAQAGHTVVVGSSTAAWKAGWSRYCHETFLYAAPEQDATAFVQSIQDAVGRLGGALVLPMTEKTVLPLSVHRRQLSSVGALFVFPAHEIVLRAFNKLETTRLAESLGIVVPRTAIAKDFSELTEADPPLRFPVVLKAQASEVMTNDHRTETTSKPLYARNNEEFRIALESFKQCAGAVLVQEFIEGRGVGFFALMRHGELLAEFAHERIRDVRPTGSGSALRRSVRPDPRVREASLAMLEILRWHGVAMVEFRLRQDGTPVFLEINGRFWNSLPLAVHSGVDFPALLAQLAESGHVPMQPRYREGVRCRWLLGDFRHLVEVWRGAPRGYTGKFPSRLKTLRDFLVPIRGTFHDNFQWDDPLPELGDWLHFLLLKLPRAWKKARSAGAEAHAQRRYSHP